MIHRDSRAAFGALLGVLAIAAVITLASVLDRERLQPGATAEQVPGLNESPLAGADRVSLESAVQRLPVPLYRPDSSLASDGSIEDVWVVSGDDPELYLRYESGLALKVRPAGASLSNEKWAAALSQDGIEGSIEDVGGVDVFLVPQTDTSLGSARFFLGGALVTLIGHGDFAVDVLRELSKSTIANAPAADAEKAAAP
jgi:hypothetical protein